jgi:hypothetical protein
MNERDVEAAIEGVTVAAIAREAASKALVDLQSQRPLKKLAALQRVVTTQHPATVGKNFSLSQAEDLLQIDNEYAAYKTEVARAEMAVKYTEATYDTAKLLAEFRHSQFKAAVGQR